jgi:hypothetical protein
MDGQRLIRLRSAASDWRQLGDETVVLDVQASTFVGLNPSATRLWAALASGTTHEDLVALLMTTYDVSREVATGDVDSFLDICIERGLIV